MTPIVPGRLTRAAIHSEAGEIEVRLSAAGNWQLHLRAIGDREWRLACSGDLEAGAVAPPPMSTREPLRLGNLLLDRAGRRVYVDDAEVKLSIREYELFLLLASQPERVFTKAELMREIWECEPLPSCRTLDCHASRLRSALRRAGAEGFVINRHGVGYKLWNGIDLGAAAGRAA